MTDYVKNAVNLVTKEPTHQEPFKIFPVTVDLKNTWTQAIDTGKPMVHDDQQNINACCNECSCICFPFTIMYDMISCPCRCVYYLYKKSIV